MKPKINVIDLDGTLVPYDSFQRYALIFLRKRKSLFKILLMSVLRFFKLIDAGTFKKAVILTARDIDNYEEIMRKFASKLHDDIDMKILDITNEQKDSMTTNVLCTASAEDYTRYLAELLQWEYVCSRIDGQRGVFVHLYGKNKISAIEQLYPSSEYIYNFAISDSLADKDLLSKFEHSILLTR